MQVRGGLEASAGRGEGGAGRCGTIRTPRASHLLNKASLAPAVLLVRHASGEWGGVVPAAAAK
jgi:hypothetical protein